MLTRQEGACQSIKAGPLISFLGQLSLQGRDFQSRKRDRGSTGRVQLSPVSLVQGCPPFWGQAGCAGGTTAGPTQHQSSVSPGARQTGFRKPAGSWTPPGDRQLLCGLPPWSPPGPDALTSLPSLKMPFHTGPDHLTLLLGSLPPGTGAYLTYLS